MNPRHCLAAIASIALSTDVVALNPPSDSNGPVTLLSCVVSPGGILEAEVDSKSDDTMACNIHCNYELGGKPFSQWLEVVVPAHFNGRLGRFDTNGGRAGNFPGEVRTCKKTEKHGSLERMSD